MNEPAIGKIHLSLDFSGAILPITTGGHGHDVVPLKPICDLLGLKWETQRAKVNEIRMAKRLGTCTPLMGGGYKGLEMICIRIDRVASWLNTINPERVRANGNVDAADFLERKQEEWDALIHRYESQCGMFAGQESSRARNKSRAVRDFIALSKEKRSTEDPKDRKVLGEMMREAAAGLGVPYQQDLIDESA